jgi:hypothetical protein
MASAALTAAPAARAQNGGDEASAQRLFDEGRALAAAGRYDEACPKFAASQELAPSGGTLLNLADCYEKDQKLASAWAKFHEVALRAHRAGRTDVEQIATDRIKQIEPRLSLMTIVVGRGADVEGLEVRRDGELVPRGAWGTALPVDGGAHRIDATAPSRQPRAIAVRLAPSGDRSTVEIPPLEPTPGGADKLGAAPEASHGATGPESPAPGGSGGASMQRTLGLAAGGAGLVALGVGAVFGLQAISKNNDAAQFCPASPRCNDPQGVTLTDDAKSAATVSTIAFVAGGVLAGAGAVLFLTAPSGSPRAGAATSRTGLALAPTGLGAALRGTW